MADTSTVMTVSTPLDDVLLFHGMHAREELGRLFELEVSFLSEAPDVDPTALLGKPLTVKLSRDEEGLRYFNGYVSRFSAGGRYGRYHRYHAEVVPWLWFLTRTADCRIFQEKSVPDILRAVFDDHQTTEVDFKLTGSYRNWNYCVQYRETDFNFVSRLMEQEGIYYYFTHDDGKHTMVVTDSTATHATMGGLDKLPFVAPGDQVLPAVERVTSWDFSKEVQTGVYAHDDYDLERPSVELKVRKQTALRYSPNDYEVYDYPGAYLQVADGGQYAGVRIDEFGTLFERCRGVTNSRGVCVGALLTLDKHTRDDQNREYLVVGTTYDLEYSNYEGLAESEGAQVACSFIAMPAAQQFRTRRLTPKPFVQGPQTAVVVGPGGDEIYTDKYGRVKVQFHWDRRGAKDENSSCWIRVSHPWAGKGWGAIANPRIGQEVIVDFLEGDPDRPIITGRVYNAELMPPYDLPANMTQTGIKSRSSKGGGPANFNEIRMEDLKGSEQLYIHAEKDQDIEVENDETHWVGHNRQKTIDNDESTHVKHDRTEAVDNNETITIGGKRTESVAKDESITISGNRSKGVAKNESVAVDGNRTETVGGAESISIAKNQAVSVKGNQGLTIDKNQTVSVGDSRTLTVKNNESTSVGKNRQASVGENDAIKAGKTLKLSAGDQITIQTGSASITMKKDGTIVIKGKDITLDGSGKVNVKAGGDIVLKGSKVVQN